MKYSIHSICSTIISILSYGVAFWVLRTFVMQNSFNLPQIEWLQQQLQASILAWIIAIPIAALIISWLLGLLVYPLVEILTRSVHHLQGWADYLPKGLSRVLASLLRGPKAVLHPLIFLLIVHVGLLYVHSPTIANMASNSSVYQWSNEKVISPILASTWTENFPVLGKQAGDWFHQLSQEAAKNGPQDSRGFWTWQTRFDSNAEIDAKARSIVKGAKNDREKAYRLYKWIGQNVEYDDSKAMAIQSGQTRSLVFGAIPTFKSRKGICSDYSALMVAMGKAVGLSVKQEFGEAFLPDGSGGPHAWNVVYLKDEQKQIPCDPTWARTGNFFGNTDFYVSHRPEKTVV